MRKPNIGISAFKLGSRHQWISTPSLEGQSLELVPTSEAIQQGMLEPIAQTLVDIVADRSDIALWLPGPAKRYGNLLTAIEALDRVAKRRDMLSWLIHTVGTGDHVSEEDRDGIKLHPDRVVGIATVTEKVRVQDSHKRVGNYVLASYWMHEVGIGLQSTGVARALLYEVPYCVLRRPNRVFASIDGPVDPFANDSMPLDPSAAFASEGVHWEGAVQLAGPKLHRADGIVSNPTTKLYRPVDIQSVG